MQNHKIKRKGLLFCLIGPAGGGKTTFCERLLAELNGSVSLSISVTTRAPRPGEREGVSYYFTSRQDFQSRVARGELFEWEEIHGNCYGTLNSTLQNSIASGVDLLLDVDIRGALNFKQRMPGETVVVFSAPPSSDELLRRIVQRGGASPQDLRTRLDTAKREYSQVVTQLGASGVIDYFLVNEDKEITYQAVRSILLAERTRLARLDADAVRAICTITPGVGETIV